MDKREIPDFVDRFVDGLKGLENEPQKLLIMIGAGDGDRTRDIQLGKLAFYR